MGQIDVALGRGLGLSELAPRVVQSEIRAMTQECDRIVQFAANLPRLEGDIIGSRNMPDVRRSQVSWIPQGPEAAVLCPEAAALPDRMRRGARGLRDVRGPRRRRLEWPRTARRPPAADLRGRFSLANRAE
jgi:hypothetical protein